MPPPQSHLPHTLPLEVFEYVIEFVGTITDRHRWPLWGTEERQNNLFSCALVCRRWVPKSRSCLYQAVYLENKRKAASFMITIMAFPRLGEYVQRLQFNLDDQHEDWIYKAHYVLPSLLPNLVHLEYSNLPILHPLFFVLSRRFNAITSLRLLSLNSWTFREIVRLLSGFPRLRTLEVESEWGTSNSFYCRPGRHHSSISLRMDCLGASSCTDNMLRWLTRKKPSNTLVEFAFQCKKLPIRSGAFNDLLRQCSGSLEALELSFDPTYLIEEDRALALGETCKFE